MGQQRTKEDAALQAVPRRARIHVRGSREGLLEADVARRRSMG